MTQNDMDHEVIISGGGPVGMALAIDLGQRGIDTLVVEKYPEPQPVPKGQNLTQRTMEHFRAWGCEAALRAARTVPAEFGIGGVTAWGTLLGEHRYDWLKRELVRPFYATDNERLPQYATEAVLRARAAELPAVTTMFRHEVTAVEQDADGVSVTVSGRRNDRDGAPPRRLRAGYVVGADGARSVVREGAGIAQEVRDHDRRMVLLVFRSQKLHEALSQYPGKSFWNVLHPDLEGYWLFFGRVDLAGEFFFHAPLPDGADPDTFDFHGFVDGAVGKAIDMDVRYKGFWDCRVAIARTYRRGRAFVAGDAAHNHPPYGGYGINTGFEDARNLGWKLAAVLRGAGGDALLGSYDTERRPVFESVARDFIEAAIEDDRTFLAAHDPGTDRAAFDAAWSARATGASAEVGRYLPNYRGSPIVFGTGDGAADALGEHMARARPGYHLPPRALAGGGLSTDRLGGGFLLLSGRHDEGIVEAAAAAGMRLEVAEPAEETAEDEAPGAAVLLRPDGFVAWTGAGRGVDAHEVVATALGRGGPRRAESRAGSRVASA